jgi:hypothetical protein
MSVGHLLRLRKTCGWRGWRVLIRPDRVYQGDIVDGSNRNPMNERGHLLELR